MDRRRPLLFVTAALLTVAGCSSAPKPRAVASNTPAATPSPTPSPSPSPTGEPKTYEAVKAAVDRQEAAAAVHDGGAVWDLLTAAGQATMSRADYAKVVADCPKLIEGTTVSIALNGGGTSATVTTSAGAAQGGTYTWSMVYENGRWKHQPSDGAMNWMSLGGDNALTVLRNDGAC